MSNKDLINIGITRGFLYAIAATIRLDRGVETRTRDLFLTGFKGFTISDFVKYGIDNQDLEVISRYWKELH